jgi:hypothetical protein
VAGKTSWHVPSANTSLKILQGQSFFGYCKIAQMAVISDCTFLKIEVFFCSDEASILQRVLTSTSFLFYTGVLSWNSIFWKFCKNVTNICIQESIRLGYRLFFNNIYFYFKNALGYWLRNKFFCDAGVVNRDRWIGPWFQIWSAL